MVGLTAPRNAKWICCGAALSVVESARSALAPVQAHITTRLHTTTAESFMVTVERARSTSSVCINCVAGVAQTERQVGVP